MHQLSSNLLPTYNQFARKLLIYFSKVIRSTQERVQDACSCRILYFHVSLLAIILSRVSNVGMYPGELLAITSIHTLPPAPGVPPLIIFWWGSQVEPFIQYLRRVVTAGPVMGLVCLLSTRETFYLSPEIPLLLLILPPRWPGATSVTLLPHLARSRYSMHLQAPSTGVIPA